MIQGELPINKVIQGDCIEEMRKLPENCIDTILTDPPYGLEFMGKNWDKGVPGISFWKEMLRVAKPGATLLSFGGTRTYHRMACAIEDAGWVIKDCIMWIYGCLSEDTKVLTKRGWKHLYKTTKDDKIRVYDITNNIYKWETPERWSIYSVNKDTCYRIKSDKTDQIVSKEHRCLVKREGKLVLKQAWELDKVEYMPVLSDNFFDQKESDRKLLFQELLWKGKGLAQTIFSKWEGNKEPKKGIKNGKEPSLEGWSNLFQKKRKLWKIQNKICSLSERLFSYGSERRLCYGTPAISSSKLGEVFNFKRSDTSQRPQSRKQFFGKLNAFFKQQSPQITRSTITKIEYTGKMFCPTVSTGAFVARRKGMVFITGNSGFPKATDISKQLDKEDTRQFRKIVGQTIKKFREKKGLSMDELCDKLKLNDEGHGGMVNHYENGRATPTIELWKQICELLDIKEIQDYQKQKKGRLKEIGKIENPISWFGEGIKKEITTPQAKLWNGWKSHGLKPAYEIVICAEKPLDISGQKSIIIDILTKLEYQLCLLLSVKTAKKLIKNIPTEQKLASIAQWNAEKNTSIKEDLLGQMDMCQLDEIVEIVLNTVILWKKSLVELWNTTNKSIIKMEIDKTIDWKILNLCLSESILQDIIKAEIKQPGVWLNASPVAKILNAVSKSINAIQELSVAENVISTQPVKQQGVVGKTLLPNYEPIIVAVKPNEGSYAQNALRWKVSGLNIDGSRIKSYTKNDDTQKTKQNIETHNTSDLSDLSEGVSDTTLSSKKSENDTDLRKGMQSKINDRREELQLERGENNKTRRIYLDKQDREIGTSGGNRRNREERSNTSQERKQGRQPTKELGSDKSGETRNKISQQEGQENREIQGRFPANIILEQSYIPLLTLKSSCDKIKAQVIKQYYENYKVPTMWEKVQDISEQNREVLREKMLLQSSKKLSISNDGQETQKGINRVDEEKQDNKKGKGESEIQGVLLQQRIQKCKSGQLKGKGIRDGETDDRQESNSGTQVSNGDETKQTLKEQRDSSPQERNKDRQQTRESGNNGQHKSHTATPQTNQRKQEIEILITDVPEAWLRYFRPTGYSIVNPESSAKLLDEQSGESKSVASVRRNKSGIFVGQGAKISSYGVGDIEVNFNDKGGASRFFYVAKSSKQERLLYGFDCAIIKVEKLTTKLWQTKENMEQAVLLARGILDLVAESLSIEGSGKSITVKCQKEDISTIKMAISKITELKTWNSLTQQPIKESIVDVFGKKTDGGNLVLYAKRSKELMTRIGILQERVGSATTDVKNATLELLLKVKEENEWNQAYSNHPTHKPIKLMEYLCILTKTPTGGIVLDPFAGSSTTALACIKTGRPYIMIEKEKEYCKIAEARIKAQPEPLL